jgi:raffinose/stachyose/melibiose transport system substrate-binding protein
MGGDCFMKKTLLLLSILGLVLTMSLIQTSSADKIVKFSGMIGGPEILAEAEQATKVFNQENPGYEMEFRQGVSNQSPYQQLTVMYNSGNVPTLFVMEPGDVMKIKDKLADLSNEKWVKDAIGWTLDDVKADGEILGAPESIQSIGILYNKKIIQKALGGKFEPSSIKTRNDLANLFKKVQDSGTAPIVVSSMNWSLGSHFLTKLYDVQSPNKNVREKFIQSLKGGNADLLHNKVFNGLIDTLDLMKKYNINKKSPLADIFEKDAEMFAKGKIAFWFMGDFAWPLLKGFGVSNTDDFGLLPVPISNNPDDFGNTQISAVVGMYHCIDKEHNSPEQQAGAKKFLEWFVYSKSGQNFMINKFAGVSAYQNVNLQPVNPLGRSTAQYIKKEKIISRYSGLPSDHWTVLGASMQKYLAGRIDKKGLAKEIEDYWKKVK